MTMPVTAWQLSLPAMLRTIFARWGEPCDPALAREAPGRDGLLYQELSRCVGSTTVSRETLAQIEADARFNAQYGQFAELRREGEQVLPWVCAVLAAGPAPQHIFIPY